MLEYAALLHLLAQVFIAFAGFAGVIAAFGSIRLSPDATALRVRFLVAIALFGLVISLLPFLLQAFAASEGLAVRVSSFVFAVGMAVIAVWNLSQAIPLFRSGELDTQAFAITNHLATAIVMIALLAVSFGFLRDISAAVYLSGLYLCLVLCSYLFIMVILAVEMKTRR